MAKRKQHAPEPEPEEPDHHGTDGSPPISAARIAQIKKENAEHDKLDREEEIQYKNKIVDLLARALQPWAWDPKEKFSAEARITLQGMARKTAINGLRAIAPYIKEPH